MSVRFLHALREHSHQPHICRIPNTDKPLNLVGKTGFAGGAKGHGRTMKVGLADSRDEGELKPFTACCGLLSIVDRLVMLKLLIKVGVSALALMLAALPVAACVLPGAGMTSAERECCKKMAEQCGEMGMAKSHPCCQPTGSPTDLHALKASSSQDHLSLVVLQGLPISVQAVTCLSLAPMAFPVSYTHSPPGLESLTNTILRI